MEAASLWAGVRFTARNGSPEALLTDAAGQGLHLYGISSLPGGFYAHCAAWQYRRLAAFARHRRVRLRVEKRMGLYFLLRPLLQRKGLWAGLVAWGLVLVWLQGFIWAVDYGSLTTGQRARAGAVLRSCGLQPGTAVTEELLRCGEYALLESGEFSWASLNFEKGRLAGGSRPCPCPPRDRRRHAARAAGKVQWDGAAYKSYQRHYAGSSRADCGSRAGVDRHCAQRAGRHLDFCPGGGHGGGAAGVADRPERSAGRDDAAADRQKYNELQAVFCRAFCRASPLCA